MAVVDGYSSDHGLLDGSVLIVELATGETQRPVARAGDRRRGRRGPTTDRLWYARFDGTGTAVGELWLDGRREERWAGDAFIGPDLTMPSVGSSATRSSRRHQAHGAAAGDRPVRRRPAALDPPDPPQRRRHRRASRSRTSGWSAGRRRDGTDDRGRLLTPRGETGPWPMIVAVHGGPTWCWNAYFSDSEPNGVLLADAGYAVLQPNPRGSAGRGHAFKERLIGDPGGIDLDDLLAGVDWAIAEGIADPARLGIAGLSYGGFMAGWAVTQTRPLRGRGRALRRRGLPGAGADVRGGGLGTRHPGRRLGRRRRPVSRALADRARPERPTPTLVIAGDLDRCTPLSQGELLVGALAAAGLRDGAAGPARRGPRAGEPRATRWRRSARPRPGSTGS